MRGDGRGDAAMTDALLLLAIAALVSVHVVLLAIRAIRTSEVTPDPSSVTPGTSPVQSDTAGMT
jgi:hypothetical protein